MVKGLSAQSFEINTADEAPYNPQNLISNYFLGEGVDIININYTGSPSATGLFNNASDLIGIERGIVLSTGKIKEINRPVSEEASTVTSADQYQDQHIENLSGHSIIRDIASYEITFAPTAEVIQFRYVFASEEYPDYVCSPFNDVFGFFITGPNPNGPSYESTNIALVPNDLNQVVSINNVNNGIVGAFGQASNCNQNSFSNAALYNSNTSEDLVFNGILDPFTATIKVIPCQTYTIKLIVADVRDELLDSAVFLEAKSFTSNDVIVQALTTNSNGIMIEGCKDGVLEFSTAEIQNSDYTIPFRLIGDATKDLDYQLSQEQAIIKAGENSTSVFIEALEDDEQEGIEEIGIVVNTSACSEQIIWIAIDDPILEEPDLPDHIYLCEPVDSLLDASIAYDVQESMVFDNEQPIEIFPERETIYSEIVVSGIYPSALAQSSFAKVCIDEIEHPWLEDLDIFLFGPDGQFIELTSDNGGDGGNATGADFYKNTCFTLNATQKINGDIPLNPPTQTANFSGEFLPEGSWNDFIGNADFQANGIWKLMMIDDYATGVGILKKWSIHFETIYDLSYEWTPSEGLSCDDCPKPIANPQSDQTYELKISDSNGCEINKQITFDFNAPLDDPILICDNSSAGVISISWEAIEGADYYLLSVNGQEFENLGQELTYSIGGLVNNEEIQFELIAQAACRQSEGSMITCTSNACDPIEFEILNMLAPSCSGIQNGMVSIGIASGTDDGPYGSDYLYTLGNESNSTGIFDNLEAGSYEVSIMDDFACQYQISFALESAVEMKIEVDVSDIGCNAATPGAIALYVSGGAEPYSYLWEDGTTSSLINIFEAGNYGVTISDANGCSQERSITINQLSSFEYSINAIQPSCQDSNDGSITLSSVDPSLQLQVQWDHGAEGPILENLTEGRYAFMIKDGFGCEVSDQILLESPSQISIDVETMDNSCHGEQNGQIFSAIEVSLSPYEIGWSNGEDSADLANLAEGSYVITITDANGCTIQEIFYIEAPDPIDVEWEETLQTVCEGFQKVDLSVLSEGGTGIHAYSFDGGLFQESNTFLEVDRGMHQIAIIDENNCEETFSYAVETTYIDGLRLEIKEPEIIKLGDEILLEAIIEQQENELQFLWTSDRPNALSCYDCESPYFIGHHAQTIGLEIINEDGCSAQDWIFLRLDNTVDVYVPNVFSPNGDGTNDLFRAFGNPDLIESFESFKVYDRFGEQLYETSNYSPADAHVGWNGYFKGKPMNPGVYEWQLRLKYIDVRTHTISGDVTLVK